MRKVPLLYLSGTVYAILLLWTLHYCNYIGKNADSGEDGGNEDFSFNLEENLRLIDDKKQVKWILFSNILPLLLLNLNFFNDT